jgi:HEAT repeat protein
MNRERLDSLLTLLKSPAPDLRLRAAQNLGELADKRAVPALVDRLADEDPAVCEAASQALLALRGREVAARLAPLLSVEQVSLRNSAMSLLRRVGEDAPDLLLDLLKDTDLDLRIFAADILGQVDAPGVSRALIDALQDPDSNVRANAATSLGRRGEAAAVAGLVTLLEDEEWVAFAAIEALALIGDASAVEPLIHCLRDGSPVLRVAVAEALGRFSDPRVLPPVLEAMRQAEGPLLQHLLSALLKGANPTILREMDDELRERACMGLIDALKDPSNQVRSDALLGLAVLGDSASVYAILDLAGRTESDDLMELIVLALASIGDLPPLVGALKSPDPRLAQAAVRALGQIGGDKALEPLIQALRHQDPEIRRLSARALGSINSPEALPALLRALGDDDDATKAQAAWALGRLSDAGTIPVLGTLLGHDHGEVRNQAMEALLSIGGPVVRKLFIEGLNGASPAKRELCARGLGRLGAGEGMGRMARLLHDPYASVRKQVVSALMVSGDRRALAFLEPVLGDQDTSVRRCLVETVARIQAPGCEALLIKALEDDDPEIRLEAIEGLGRAGAAEAVDPLLALLDCPESKLKVSAAKALGAIGESRASSILINLLTDQNPKVRAAANAAIQKIQGGW